MRTFRMSGMNWTVILCVIVTILVATLFLSGCESAGKVDPLALQQLNTNVQAGVDAANAEAERARAAAATAHADAEKALADIGTQLKAKLAAIDAAATLEEKATAEKALAAAQAQQDATKARLDELTERLAKAEATAATMAKIKDQSAEAGKKVASAINPDGSVSPEGVAGVVAPLLPPPWNVLAVVAGAVVGGGVGEWRRRNALTALIKTRADLQEQAQALQSVVEGLEKAKSTNETLKTGLRDSAPILLSSYTPLAKQVVRNAAV